MSFVYLKIHLYVFFRNLKIRLISRKKSSEAIQQIAFILLEGS